MWDIAIKGQKDTNVHLLSALLQGFETWQELFPNQKLFKSTHPSGYFNKEAVGLPTTF